MGSAWEETSVETPLRPGTGETSFVHWLQIHVSVTWVTCVTFRWRLLPSAWHFAYFAERMSSHRKSAYISWKNRGSRSRLGKKRSRRTDIRPTRHRSDGWDIHRTRSRPSANSSSQKVSPPSKWKWVKIWRTISDDVTWFAELLARIKSW